MKMTLKESIVKHKGIIPILVTVVALTTYMVSSQTVSVVSPQNVRAYGSMHTNIVVVGGPGGSGGAGGAGGQGGFGGSNECERAGCNFEHSGGQQANGGNANGGNGGSANGGNAIITHSFNP